MTTISKVNPLMQFNFNNSQVRVVEKNNETWFVAKDVAEILGYSDTAKAIRTHCKGVDETATPTASGQQLMKIIREPDVYRLTAKSKLPEAVRFEEFLFEDLLPTVRSTGQYRPMTAPPESNDSYILKLAFDVLRVDDASRIKMLEQYGIDRGLNMNFLPSYAESTKKAASISSLLEANGSKLSAVKANKILIDLGYLEELSRDSSKGTIKKYKSVTEKGLPYGKNLTSPNNLKESQPHWYEKSFPELLELIESRI